MNIAPGQRVALVGRTGSGKSTLGKLLIGLLTPTQGTISFDGIPLQELNYRGVRSQFGVVLQESFIFSGSVCENIALNHPEMDMAQVMRAAQLAAIHEDIEKMPMGYETVMSEGGSSFSGGQRQRLALAHQPAVLLASRYPSILAVEATMNIIHERCAGLDVHKKIVVVCALVSQATVNPRLALDFTPFSRPNRRMVLAGGMALCAALLFECFYRRCPRYVYCASSPIFPMVSSV